jgi:cellulase/cellobiase CelA1
MTENLQPKPIDLKTAEGVKSFMSGSASEAEWNSRCDQVKATNNGDYPSFWYPTVVLGGVAKQTAANWNGSAEIKVQTIPKAK